jgi:alpha-tubulin suppressor-like RCC1 family protein
MSLSGLLEHQSLPNYMINAVGRPLEELARHPTGMVAVVDATNIASLNNSLPPSLRNASVGNVVAISAGFDLASALTTDGRIEYWSVNSLKKTTPVPDRVQGQAISPMSIGGAHNMVVTSGGNLDIWLDPPGQDKFGLLNVPAAVTNGSVQAVAAGVGHALVLTKGGSVIAWGLNADDQAQVPPIVSAGGATMIAASFNSSLAITQVSFCPALGCLLVVQAPDVDLGQALWVCLRNGLQ